LRRIKRIDKNRIWKDFPVQPYADQPLAEAQ
jgi:hypothetical protein